jgi:acetyltransferase-like isoleucine patch superfamily enzyme
VIAVKSKPFVKRLLNRMLHVMARLSPGSSGFRLSLHRLRGVTIGKDVFIGDDVYLENEYPECVQIGDGVYIGVRTIIFAHARGTGKVVIGKMAYIGPNCVIATSAGRALVIGEGSVIGASSVITADVAPYTFVRPEPPRVVADVTVPLSTNHSFQEFVRGLKPRR